MTSGLWYRALLSDERNVAGHIAAIGEQFATALEAASWPDGACLFVTTLDAGTEGAELFFSPASVSAVPHLIVLYKAEPSPPPERASATLIVGKQADWDLLPRQTH